MQDSNVLYRYVFWKLPPLRLFYSHFIPDLGFYCFGLEISTKMGKAKKIKVSKKDKNPALSDQILKGEFAEPTGRVKERPRADEDEEFVNNKLSKSIIQQARIQVLEEHDCIFV